MFANLIVSAILAPSAAMGGQVATDAGNVSVSLPASMATPCAYEDSVNCSWNAGTSGNGEGHSFVVREFPGNKHLVCVMYVRAEDAHMDYCA